MCIRDRDYGVFKILSKDDKHGEKILKSTIKCENNRYTVAVMRKNDNDVYPESKSMALKRLFANERVFARKKEYAEKFDDVIQDYVNSDHAELLTVEESKIQTPTTWYLPNFGVDNGKKVRVVFDGAAECNRTSLNENLLRGPNYLISMIGILLRYRLKLIPLSADIEKMYHQVLVSKEDRDSFRFVYRKPFSTGPPLTYRMKVHVFGAVSSPSTCIFALNKCAEDNSALFPKEAKSVTTSFYVDNYLESFDSKQEAIDRARGLRKMLALGGFNLTKWITTSRTMLNELSAFGLASPTIDLDFDELPTEQTLGVLWTSHHDAFLLKFKIDNDFASTPTKSKFLGIIARVFDPLGFVAPVLLVMKSLMQEIWKL